MKADFVEVRYKSLININLSIFSIIDYKLISAKENSAVTDLFQTLILSIERGGHEAGENPQEKPNKCIIA
jgi:hypothetical protein